MWTEAEIREKVSTDPRWAARAILRLAQQQTSVEYESGSTRNLNGVGFNMIDAPILTSFARRLGKGWPLTEKQLAVAYKVLPKYSRQLLSYIHHHQ